MNLQIGTTIKDLRIKHGITQETLAFRLDLCPFVISTVSGSRCGNPSVRYDIFIENMTGERRGKPKAGVVSLGFL